ncbi:MAG TPA: glycosyltransferase, partial [Flavobacteriales bacterium]
TERFHPKAAAGAADTVVIGTVKSFAPKYGVDTLIEAFALLVKDDRPKPPLALRLVGGGSQEEELRTLAASLGVGGQVTFVPRVPHGAVPEELMKLDIYAALSRLDSESFGVAVIEASACGLPVVVSDAGGLPEVVVDGRTGTVVRRDDPLAAAEALYALVVDPDRRRAMGQDGRTHVQRVYEWEHCVQRMLDVLQRAAHRHRQVSVA